MKIITQPQPDLFPQGSNTTFYTIPPRDRDGIYKAEAIIPKREYPRKELGKILEEKKIRARQVRQQFMEDLKKLEKVPEDELKRSEEGIQNAIDECIKNLQTLADEKSLELMSI